MRATRSSLISLALLFPRFALAQAPTSSADPIDDYVHSEMQRQRIPGLSLLVAHDGKIVRAQGYGLGNSRSRSSPKPCSNQDRWESNSRRPR
jgi:CubicO group peptidase (beta-lactamase class C family)